MYLIYILRRQWNLILVEERVKINKRKENLKSQKLEIKI